MTRSDRIKKLIKKAGLIGVIGLAYAFFCMKTGWALPCPVRSVTGLLCPGCGVTRVCLALLRLDVAGAWRANPALTALLPVLAGLMLRMGYVYVETGRTRPTRRQSVLIWAMAAALLVFGVARNLV